MNLFVLDLDPVLAAKYHCDIHVISQFKEAVQILSTVHHLQNSPIKDGLPLATHENHPCVKWVRKYRQNYRWTYRLAKQLALEFTQRYDGKIHAMESDLLLLKRYPPGLRHELNDICSRFAMAMPEEFKHPNPVAAYRRYYHHKAETMKVLWLRGRETPPWWNRPIYFSGEDLNQKIGDSVGEG